MGSLRFDPFAAELVDDPYPVYQILREHGPVYFNAERDIWAVSRYDDVQRAARDWKTFANEPGVELDEMIDAFGRGDFLNMDPPRHDELRDLLRDRFTPKAVAALEVPVRRAVSRLLDDLSGRTEVDLAADFAWPLPIALISHMLGIPEDDGPLLMGWLHALDEREPGEQSLPSGVTDAANELKRYLISLCDERERDPRDDVLSLIARLRRHRDIEPEEVPGLAFLLIVAGTDTAAGLLSSSLITLDRHRDQQELLTLDEVEITAAIEELLRFESPVQMLARTTTVDTEIGGEAIPARARVLLLWGSANRDERRFENGNVLDLRRGPKRNLAFGEGIHFCLGAALARLEARIALQEFFRRVASYEISGLPQWIRSPTNRGLTALPATIAFH